MSGCCHLPPGTKSSRTDADQAWNSGSTATPSWKALLDKRVRPRWTNFSWISPATLLDSINDQIVKGVEDVIEGQRMRWIASLREARRAAGGPAPDPEWWFQPVAEARRFVIMGDPGEQDASQYAVVSPLVAKAKAEKSQFMVVMSDVIYPAGDVNDYIDGFFRAYEEIPGPIYALPGNHDWYDGLEGFMFHFCGAEPLAPTAHRGSSYRFAERVAQRVWRRSSRPDREALYRYGSRRATSRANWAPLQPGPYYALETEDLVLVCIDTGITGDLDAEQGDWLLRVARHSDKPKVLVTGKPIYVDGKYHPGRIRWRRTAPDGFKFVDDIVREQRHNFVAAIGGDIHNYQHYSVKMRDPKLPDGSAPEERRIEYLVSGGGGAYLSATHKIGKVDLPAVEAAATRSGAAPVGEADFCCYPLRGDSLALFTRGFGRTLGWLFAVGWTLLIAAAVAVALLPGPSFTDTELPSPGFVALAAVVLVVLVGGVVFLGTLLGAVAGAALREPLGVPIRGLVSIAVAVALGAACVATAELLRGDPWAWLPEVMVATALLIAVPVAAILLAYYGRGIGPAVTGHVVLAAAIVVPLVVLGWPADVWSVALVIAAGAVAIALLALASAALLRVAKRWYPRTLTILAVLVPFAVLVYFGVGEDERYAQVALAALAGHTIALFLAAAVVAWPAALQPWKFIPADMDPDDAVAEYARRHGTERERASAPPEPQDGATRWLSHLLLAWPRFLNQFVAELAEASGAPFFKSFLTVNTSEKQLTIDCWGITGYAEQETAPTLEDRVEIALRRG